AAGAFDDALKTHQPGNLPLLCFGLFQTVEKVSCPESGGAYQLGEWTPSVTRSEYGSAIAAIKEHIAAGDTYQVNYTFRLNAEFSGSPFDFFCDLAEAQQGRYAAFIETGGFAICSASPELFFELKDGVITSRPMKGTMPRALTAEADRAVAEALRSSAKDRAENIMIVDMIRNDIGRVAEAGSVETLSRFDVEKYPTVWQMTSTVKGKLAQRRKGTKIAEIMKALFPCASITGAPKAKTMEIIRSLEKGPRGIYTGAIGFIAPDGAAQFNVAIRTAVVDRINGLVEYGIGGGIVWDSNADAEYEEAITKSRILARRSPEMQPSCFQLLETMLYEPGQGIFLLERHLKRLANSAEYFGFSASGRSAEGGQWLNDIRGRLYDLEFEEPMRIRLLVNKDGSFDFQCLEISVVTGDAKPALAKEPIDSSDVFLYHKTTNRAVYERANADEPEADDVLLFNERGEVTESCIANVMVELDGRKVTPPVSCGLLAGTFRDELIAKGEIEERIITLDDLKRAKTVWLINSVRKWREVVLLQNDWPQKGAEGSKNL
ncbi:MAG: aminodeoxychorismate synthase component I, partial [Kiritimatiellales bacterium]